MLKGKAVKGVEGDNLGMAPAGRFCGAADQNTEIGRTDYAGDGGVRRRTTGGEYG